MNRDVLWIWLRAAVGEPIGMWRLYQKTKNIETIYEATAEQYKAWGITSDKRIRLLLQKDLRQAQNIAGICENFSIGIMTIEDADYPPLLREIPVPPCLLFYVGDFSAISRAPMVTMLGTRKCDIYGAAQAKEVTEKLCRLGLTPVCGCADGIETAVQQAATDLGMPSIMVMPAGLLTYSGTRKRMMSRVSRFGAVISECLPSENMGKNGYPARNRIMAGLSPAGILIQAPRESGAFSIAGTMVEYNREVFAMPGAVGNPLSAGAHELIRQGAPMYETAEDILSVYLKDYKEALSDYVVETSDDFAAFVQSTVETPRRENGLDDELQQQIYAALTEAPAYAAAIAEKLGKSASQVISALSVMELYDLVESGPGGTYKIK